MSWYKDKAYNKGVHCIVVPFHVKFFPTNHHCYARYKTLSPTC